MQYPRFIYLYSGYSVYTNATVPQVIKLIPSSYSEACSLEQVGM